MNSFEHRGAEVGIADILKVSTVMKGLQPDRLKRLCRLFGFDLDLSTLQESVPGTDNDDFGKPSRGGDEPAKSGTETVSQRPFSSSNQSLPELPLLEDTPVSDDHEHAAINLFSRPSVRGARPLPATPVEHLGAPMRCAPLLRTRWFRALIMAMIGVQQRTDEIDVDDLVKRTIAQQPIEEIQYLTKRELPSQMQIVLDSTESMRPFWSDQTGLLQQLRSAIGSRSVDVVRFHENIAHFIQRETGRSAASRLRFHVGSVVLIVTDFGFYNGFCGAPQSNWESWLWVKEYFRRRNILPAALIPVPESDWPVHFRNHFPISLAWDVTTSPQMARRVYSASAR